MISIAIRKLDSEVNKLTDSEDEAKALAVNPVVATTKSRMEFMKEHDQMVIDPPKMNVPKFPEVAQTPLEDMAETSKQGGPLAPLPLPLKPIMADDKRPKPRFSKPLDRVCKV